MASDIVTASTHSPPAVRSDFDGGYLLFRRTGPRLKRHYAGNPRFRHPTRAAAEQEAERLLALFPDSTFVVLHEVGTVKGAAR